MLKSKRVGKMRNNYIWLFGENVGKTSENNSFYFWKYCVNLNDGIDKYFIMEKNATNIARFSSLSHKEKKWIVWKNTIKHFRLFFTADLFFVTLSYRDVRPEHLAFREFKFMLETPVIYLQHGTIAIKKLDYEGKGYNNNFLRFVYYNPCIKNTLKEVNDFRDYQLYYGKYHPRYMELLKRNDVYVHEHEKEKKAGKKILWFLTWREYKTDELGFVQVFMTLKYILSSQKLKEYLSETESHLSICFHRNFEKTKIRECIEKESSENIDCLWADEIDLMNLIVQNDILITDYSSLGFDFTLLRKPVLIFTPDLLEYSAKREFYCDIEELGKYAVCKPVEMIDMIINQEYNVNSFFSSRMPSEIDYRGIKEGKYIEKMYSDFAEMQKHKITFLGYNFYGIGGTVFATRALAEVLMERGYMVELFSLVRNRNPEGLPYGLNMRSCYATRKTIRNYIKRALFKYQKRCFYYLAYDDSKKNLNPYAGYGMKKRLKKIRSETVISTRESLHLFLNDTISDYVKNKIYFFHCQAEVLDQLFPGCMDQLRKRKLENVIHVSEENKLALQERYDYPHGNMECVLGNALEISRIADISSIKCVEKKEKYKGVYLLRVSKERKTDIDNLLGFVKYLKENGITDIQIDLYGQGDYLEELYKTILECELDDYIKYCGFTSDIKSVFNEHDALVDFSRKHSFGMPYIEGVLNGKPVFCYKNVGSSEVFEKFPEVFIEDYKDLAEKIHSLPSITVDELKKRYEEIDKKYGRKIVGDRFLEFMEQINKQRN